MSKTKAVPSNNEIETPIQVLKEATCPTSSGKSTLTYQIGVDESDDIQLKISGNDGGGFWSAEWVRYNAIQSALNEWPADHGITSMTFRNIFRGKSANTPGFLVAVLCAEGIIERMGEKKRVHQACDPSAFMANVEALRKGTASASKTKAKAKATSPAKAKTATKATVKTAKTPRKSPARSKKAK